MYVNLKKYLLKVQSLFLIQICQFWNIESNDRISIDSLKLKLCVNAKISLHLVFLSCFNDRNRFLCRCEYHWNISPQPRSLLSDQTQWAQIPFLKIRPKFRPKVTDPDPKNGFIRQENAAPPLWGYPGVFGGQTPPDPLRLLPCLAGSVLHRPVLRVALLRSSFRSLS